MPLKQEKSPQFFSVGSINENQTGYQNDLPVNQLSPKPFRQSSWGGYTPRSPKSPGSSSPVVRYRRRATTTSTNSLLQAPTSSPTDDRRLSLGSHYAYHNKLTATPRAYHSHHRSSSPALLAKTSSVKAGSGTSIYLSSAAPLKGLPVGSPTTRSPASSVVSSCTLSPPMGSSGESGSKSFRHLRGFALSPLRGMTPLPPDDRRQSSGSQLAYQHSRVHQFNLHC